MSVLLLTFRNKAGWPKIKEIFSSHYRIVSLQYERTVSCSLKDLVRAIFRHLFYLVQFNKS